MDDEHQALTMVPIAAVARRGVAIWRKAMKNSDGDGASDGVATLEQYSCIDIHPLSEGENWIKCTIDEDLESPIPITIVKRYDDIISEGGNDKNSSSKMLVSLICCIDVDNDGQCATVKHVATKSTSNDEEDDGHFACFYLARKKSLLQSSGWRGDIGRDGGEGDGTFSKSIMLDSSSTTRVQLHLPPKEMDMIDSNDDNNSQILVYDTSVPLPHRQLRLLKDGDRILLPMGAGVKLEYVRNMDMIAVAGLGSDAGRVVVQEVNDLAQSRLPGVISGTPTTKQEQHGSMNFTIATPMTNEDDDDDDLVHSDDELLSRPDSSASPKQTTTTRWMERRRQSEAEEEKMEAPPKQLSLHSNAQNPSHFKVETALNFDDAFGDGDDSTKCPNDDIDDNDDEEIYPKQLLTQTSLNVDTAQLAAAKNGDEDDSTECPDDDHDAEEHTITNDNIPTKSCADDKDDINDGSTESYQAEEFHLATDDIPTIPSSAADESINEKDVVDQHADESSSVGAEKKNPSTDEVAISTTELIPTNSNSTNINANDDTVNLSSNTTLPTDLPTESNDIAANNDSSDEENAAYQAETQKLSGGCFQSETQSAFNDSTDDISFPTDYPMNSADIADNNTSNDEDTAYQAVTQKSLDEGLQAESQAGNFPSTNTLEQTTPATTGTRPSLSGVDATETQNSLDECYQAETQTLFFPTTNTPARSSSATGTRSSHVTSAEEKDEHPAIDSILASSSRDRKRKRPSSEWRRESSDAIKIMFTGINPTRRHKQMIHDIGAQLVDTIEEASSATRELILSST